MNVNEEINLPKLDMIHYQQKYHIDAFYFKCKFVSFNRILAPTNDKNLHLLQTEYDNSPNLENKSFKTIWTKSFNSYIYDIDMYINNFNSFEEFF